jgi:hypothetical protein
MSRTPKVNNTHLKYHLAIYTADALMHIHVLPTYSLYSALHVSRV